MYSSRGITPIQRMRGNSNNGGIGPRQSATQGVGPSPKRRSMAMNTFGGTSTATTPKLNGDYHVLKRNVERERYSVRQARVALANSLDQLGEHHVRQQEYDDAMDAFTEALREKRSVYSQINNAAPLVDHGHSMRSRTSDFSNSFLSGMENNGGEDSVFGGASQSSEPPEVQHDKAIDEIVNTLRNMGNVHSLRGEQDEAMRYFTEVTSLRAQKSSNLSVDPSTAMEGGEARSVISGFNDDTSTLMSEINEDVKALDDLFRSISFRNGQLPMGGASDKASVASSAAGSTEKRKSKQGGYTSKRRKSSSANISLASSVSKQTRDSASTAANGVIVENEPFKRSAASSSKSHNNIPATGNEVSEAIEMYRSVLEDSYDGPRQEQHHEMLNSLSLRAELLLETRRQQGAESSSDTAAASSSKATDLELALEIYNQVLVAHEETSLARKQHRQEQQEGGASPSSSMAHDDEMEEQNATLIASTLICMGSIYYKLGNRVEELQMYRQAKSVYKRALGEQHVFVAGTRKNIGMVLAERGEYEEAMNQFHKAMRIYLAVNQGSDMNRDVASAMSCMGNVKNRVGELDDALEQYMEALRIYKSLYQFQHEKTIAAHSPRSTPLLLESELDALRDVTATLKVIGMVHAKKGDLDMAMQFFQDAMQLLRTPEIEKTTTGRETMASVLTRIASIHLKKADFEQAMSNYREAYDLTVHNRGTTNHPEVAGILHYIGGIYHKRADYDEAMACYQEAIRIYHATLGPGNPTVAGTLVMVGSIYYKRRNLDSAMMFYREALRLNRDAYGLHFPDVAPILKSIGTIMTKKGEYKEAYDIFRDVLSIKCTVHGLDHPEVASAYKSLGNVHYKLGELADAERQYRHALSIYRKTKGEEHADTVSAKTTIEHLRYWMREREQRQSEQRHPRSSSSSGRASGTNRETGHDDDDDERSC